MKKPMLQPTFQASSRQDAKAKIRDDASRAIIDAEANARRIKTERLKAARLAQEAAAVPAEKKKPVRKAATARKAKA